MSFHTIDNFDDNSLDTTIWKKSGNAVEQNQRMEITGTNAWNVNGIITLDNWSYYQGIQLKVTLTTPSSVHQSLVGFTGGSSLNFNNARAAMFNLAGSNALRVWVNGSFQTTGYSYVNSTVYHLRIVRTATAWEFYVQSDTDATFATEVLVKTATVSASGRYYIQAQLFESGRTIYVDDIQLQYPDVFLESQDGMVFQRDGATGYGDMPLSGLHNDATGIAARVTLEDDTVVIDWTTVDASANADGTWSGTLSSVPVGTSGGAAIWYNVDVRQTNDTGKVQNGTDKIGMGMVGICSGQSNAEYMFVHGTDLTADSALRWLRDGVWSDPSTTGNGAIQLGNDLISQYKMPVGLVDAGVGGNALVANWMSGTPDNPTSTQPFQLMLDSLSDGGIAAAAEFIWFYGGEKDAQNGVTDWNTQFDTFITSWLRYRITNGSAAASLPVVFAQLNKYNDVFITNDEWQEVQNDQALVTTSGSYMIATIDQALRDTVHLSDAGQTQVGKRVAAVVKYALGAASASGRMTAGYSVVDTSNIDIKITHSAGTDTTPTGATSATTFTVLDNGSPIVVNSALYQGTAGNVTTYRLVLATPYSGTLTVQYNYGRNPTTTNAIQDNSTTVFALESIGSMSIYVPSTGGIPVKMASYRRRRAA